MTALAWRQLRFGALSVVVFTALMSALVAGQYQSTFAGALDAGSLRALAADPAVRTLFGPPLALDDPGGFTVWRTGTPIVVLAGVWAVLTATRLTRGDEDAGRWELLLSGRITARELLTRRLAVLAAALLAAGAAVTGALLATGTGPAGAVVHGAGVAATGWVFAAVGALAAQVLPSRAPATGAAVALLGASLLARMISDGLDAPAWLYWSHPFGLVSQLRPYAGNRPGPLVVLVVLAVLIAVVAVAIAGRRDLRGAPLALDGHRRSRIRLLGSVTGFAVRRALRPWMGWALGIGTYYGLIGLLTVSVSRFLTDNRRFGELAAGAGFGGLGSPEGFAAAMFSLLAIPAGLYAAVRLGAFAEDETSRRAVLLFGAPRSRWRLLGAELAVVAVGTVLLAGTGGLALWLGATVAGAPLGLGGAVAGALNTTPVALLSLGAALVAFGGLPKATVAFGALPCVGGFLYQVIARSSGATGWWLDLSPYAHLTAVPEASPDWGGGVGLLAVAVVLTALGAVGYARRDLLL